MGVMSSSPIAILERKKDPFLKAFLRYGKVAPATRAVRISRDAVYDWRRSDPDFRRKFNQAKRERYDHETKIMAIILDLVLESIRPVVPSDVYPKAVAAANLKLSNRRFKDDASPTVRVTSRKARFPSFDVHPEPASSENDGSRDPQGKNGHLS